MIRPLAAVVIALLLVAPLAGAQGPGWAWDRHVATHGFSQPGALSFDVNLTDTGIVGIDVDRSNTRIEVHVKMRLSPTGIVGSSGSWIATIGGLGPPNGACTGNYLRSAGAGAEHHYDSRICGFAVYGQGVRTVFLNVSVANADLIAASVSVFQTEVMHMSGLEITSTFDIWLPIVFFGVVLATGMVARAPVLSIVGTVALLVYALAAPHPITGLVYICVAGAWVWYVASARKRKNTV